jgi:GT2 family glycosyltransferase
LLVRSYFLRGLRYIDERYAQSWADAEVAAQIRRAAKKIYLLPVARAVRHDDGDFLSSLPADARALLSADWVLGAAAYAGKHFGFLAGLKLRLGAMFAALGQAILALVRLREIGYHFSRLRYLLSGQKTDGTQTVM